MLSIMQGIRDSEKGNPQATVSPTYICIKPFLNVNTL